MDITFNSNGFGNLGVDREAFGGSAVGAGREAKDASGIGKGHGARDVITFTKAPVGLVSAEPVGDVPDAALTRDDELGKAVNAAFNLPPPPMPSFAD